MQWLCFVRARWLQRNGQVGHGKKKVAILDKLKLLKHGTSQRSAAEQLDTIGFGCFHNMQLAFRGWIGPHRFDHPAAYISHFGPVRGWMIKPNSTVSPYPFIGGSFRRFSSTFFFTRSNVKPIVISPNELFTLLMAGDGTQQKWSRSKGNRPRSRWPNPRSTSSSPSRRKRLRRRRPPPTPPSRRRRPTFPVIWRYYRVFFPVLPNWTSFTGKCKVSFLSIFT